MTNSSIKTSTSNARKVIYDTDPGVDDAMALYYALAHPGIEVVGITTTFGNVTVEQAAINGLYLTEIAGKKYLLHKVSKPHGSKRRVHRQTLSMVAMAWATCPLGFRPRAFWIPARLRNLSWIWHAPTPARSLWSQSVLWATLLQR